MKTKYLIRLLYAVQYCCSTKLNTQHKNRKSKSCLERVSYAPAQIYWVRARSCWILYVRFHSIKIRQYSIEAVSDNDIIDDYDDSSHSDISNTTCKCNVKKGDKNHRISLGWDYLEFSDR